MPSATFTLSAFGNEIAGDLQAQLALLGKLRVGCLDLRSVGKKNVLQIDDDEVAAIGRACAAQGIGVACIDSPIGRTPLASSSEQEAVHSLTRTFRIAETLGTRTVRVFSFCPPAGNPAASDDSLIEAAIARLAALTRQAQQDGFTLLLQNDQGTLGDTPERCQALLSAIDSPHLRFAWDAAGFVRSGVDSPSERGWPLLGPYVAHVHATDARPASRACLPGEGNGQLPQLLTALRQAGYQGCLSLEPSRAGDLGSGIIYAVAALRQLMADCGCEEG
jgi:sugar phosphate isomerase/epimerase